MHVIVEKRVNSAFILILGLQLEKKYSQTHTHTHTQIKPTAYIAAAAAGGTYGPQERYSSRVGGGQLKIR